MPRRQQLGLFLVVFAVFLALGSREPPWTDAKQIYGVAESIVHRGELSIQVNVGVPHNGRTYAIYPLLTSLVHVPGAALERAVAKAGPEAAKLVRPLAGHLGPAAVGALLCLLFLHLCLDRGVSPRVATAGALALSFTTLVMVYARSPYSEITQAACFLGYFLWLLRLIQTPGRRQAIILGVWIGLLVNTKALYVLAVPGGALLVALTVGRRLGWRPLLSLAGWVCVGGAPFADHVPGLQLRAHRLAVPDRVSHRRHRHAAVRRAHRWWGCGGCSCRRARACSCTRRRCCWRWWRRPGCCAIRPATGAGPRC